MIHVYYVMIFFLIVPSTLIILLKLLDYKK